MSQLPRRPRPNRADLEALGLRPRRRPPSCGCWTLLAALACILLVAGLATWQALGARLAPAAAATHTPPPAGAVPAGTFAFVRDGQIYLGRQSGAPRQVTAFPQPDRVPTDWGPLVWAPDNRHLAVAIGSPIVAPDPLATAAGTLYIVDTRTGGATLVAPQRTGDPGLVVGPSAYGWRDTGTLLFAAAGSVLSYALATGVATPLAGLVGKAIELEVRGAGLYYSSYQTPEAPLTILAVALRRHDLRTSADVAVANLGLALFQATGCGAVGCQAAPGAPSLAPAWDVSADESQLAFERLTAFAPDESSATASFWYLAPDPAPTASAVPARRAIAPQRIFADAPSALPAGVPGTCCFLRFAPDGRGLVLSSGYAMPSAFGPDLLYPQQLTRGTQVGYPWAFGPAAWDPTAASFTLVTHQRNAPSTALLTYANQRTVVLQANAYGCAWAYAPPA